MSTNTSSQPASASANLPSTQLALRALDLGKTYQLYSTPSDRLKQILFGKKKQYFKEFSALKRISFDLPKGEVLGLVGRNGAGKSTLLQLICGTLTASQGELQVNGRIAALLELGAGFNPQFTGRENIYLSATVMGISRQEIDDKIESIIEFSGIRPFIEQPVSTYSSGMYVRLAFSVATSVDPDILVIDEALSVGDGDFARRSFERIMSMKEAGKTILFCSHSLYQIEVLCTQAIWIEKGEVRATGLPSDVVPQYQSFLDQLGDSEEQAKAQARENKAQAVLDEQEPVTGKEDASAVNRPSETQTETDSTGELPQENTQVSTIQGDEKKQTGVGARLTRVTGMTHSPDGSVESGKILNLESRTTDVTIDVEFQSYLTDEIPQVALAIHSAGGQLITSCGCWVDNVTPTLDKDGKGRIRIHYPNMPLFKGTYYVGVLLFCERGLFLHDEADPAITLHVTQPNQERGVVYIPHTWQTDGSDTIADTQSEETCSGMNNPASRWHTEEASNIPPPQLFRLFERCFGHPLTPELWRWKYQHAISPGVAVLERERVVAFNGGMPRAGLLFGENSHFVQMGDIMVDPKTRGVLTKKGPFYLAVQAYLEKNIGEGKCYSHGFGFPNERAYLVGEKQNVYANIDIIQEPHWPIIYEPTDSGLMDDAGLVQSTLNLDLEPLTWSLDPRENSQTNYQIDQLWQKMSLSLRHLAVGNRDSRWLQYRYHNKPDNDYKLYWVKRTAHSAVRGSAVTMNEPVTNESAAIDGTPATANAQARLLGLIVVKHHPDQGVELLDFLCEKQDAEWIISAAQLLAGRLAPNLTSSFDLFAWMTPSVVSWFDPSKAEIRATPVIIPGSALDNKAHAQQIKGKWWLLGGDSDFR
ncbi:ATP-binding cassette domain-containing protein [Marinomonas sp. 15G1-11]|uniref:ATP-binding cassette domain-containing protein n=1 Tax=Marinomonas phaeophyticola TaxID=3004091 RepID=A0ABT4JT01_9GAMM|nr:ATP-binding cassette domain-containing protein [Marinomonas sp. 15G1-11]MCZ2721350.1 ATP-binding cassette domain-containing protein [Marinomonas sp. 15G1-11]